MRTAEKRIALYLIMICCACAACGKAEEKKLQIVFQYQMDYWDAYDLSGSSIPDQKEFEALAQSYIQETEKLLGISGWWEKINPGADTLILNLCITGETGSVSRASYGKRALDNEVEAGISLGGMALTKYHSDGFLAHELTHVMVGPSFSISLEDGLCQYVQGTIGLTSHMPGMKENGIAFEQYFKTYHEYCKISAEEGAAPKPQDIIDSVGKAGRQYPEGQRMMWMMYSESFVRYLISQYGTDRTMELIIAGEEEGAYEKILGKNLTELKDGWISSVEAVEQQYTWEEIGRMEQEFLQK